MSSNQAVFPPEVLARITPELSLDRHVAVGLRPSLREFDEFRVYSSKQASLEELGSDALVGLATVKQGDSHAFCGITFGVTEVNAADELLKDATPADECSPVYPIVEVARGRIGAPTDEEMILSQKLYNHVLHLQVLPLLLLAVKPGYQLSDENGKPYVFHPDAEGATQADLDNLEATISMNKKTYRYVLYAHIKVFSRAGPLFDLVHYTLLQALRSVALPKLYFADLDSDPTVRVPVRSRGNVGHLQGSARINADPDRALFRPLALNEAKLGVSSSFGLIETAAVDGQTAVLLADLEGEAEESCAESRVTVVATKDTLQHVSVVGGGANVTLDTIRATLATARQRVAVVEQLKG